MKLQIRSANADDIQSIILLRKELDEVNADLRPDLFTLTNYYTEEDVRNLLHTENSNVVVVEKTPDNRVLGYAVLKMERTEQHLIFNERTSLFVQDFSVHEDVRGQGVGQFLFDYIVAYAKENNVDSLELNVFAENDRAMQFYESNGMREKTRRLELDMK
ncbi:GNAT family N-acetyltransferase [Paenibacillus sp. Marseille-Q4541]|uniref:GNAT family N-acetyltransferase n=1 Tax=Paenibacillus sp. Marseille-Q4541 TaxID=2831522 RepID=UPI001BA67A3C|nr:GNAT family N-acetyltransferase [Paenibacillus sp. Marseille-Q4541]